MSNPLETAGSVGARRPNSAPTYVIEFLVNELADGVTPAPQFEIDGEIPSDGAFPDEQQIYTVPVDRLGLIDLSFSGILPSPLAEQPANLGQRYVPWIWAHGLVLGSASPIHKADNIRGSYVNLEALEVLPLGSTQFYSRKGYIMPQGTVLRVANMAPEVPGIPFVIRIAVVIPPTERDDALMREAFCCTENTLTTTDSDADCRSPTILTPGVEPNQITQGVNTVQINAYPVSPEFTTVTIVGPTAPVTPTDVQVVFPDKILFTGNFAELGNYSVTVSNGEGCEDTSANAITVNPAG